MYQPSEPDPTLLPTSVAIAVASTSEDTLSSDRAALPGPHLPSMESDITAVLMHMAYDLHVLSPRGALLVAWAHSQWPDRYGAYFTRHCRPRILWSGADLDAPIFDEVYALDDAHRVEHIPAYRLPALVALRSAPTTRLTDANRWKDTPPLTQAVSAPSQPRSASLPISAPSDGDDYSWLDQDALATPWEQFSTLAILALFAAVVLGFCVWVVYLLFFTALPL